MSRRSFNYADAVRLRAEGLSVPEIALRLHVSTFSVVRALRPERQAYEVEYQRARRERMRRRDSRTPAKETT